MIRQNDNLYKTGAVVSAKKDPNVKLLIRKYIHRTYYCTVLGEATLSNLAYHEDDLLPASPSDQHDVLLHIPPISPRRERVREIFYKVKV